SLPGRWPRLESSAEGTACESPAWQCRVRIPKSGRVPKGRHLPERILGIKPHSRFPNHGLEFHVIRPAAMMFSLVLDVIHDGGLVRTAHAKGTVSFLPRECDSMFTNPS